MMLNGFPLVMNKIQILSLACSGLSLPPQLHVSLPFIYSAPSFAEPMGLNQALAFLPSCIYHYSIQLKCPSLLSQQF